jgi:hypothetical protein
MSDLQVLDEDFVRYYLSLEPNSHFQQEFQMSNDMIPPVGLNKAEVLAKLYNASKPLEMGFLQFTPGDMSVELAQSLLDNGQTYFDYLQGRVMKIDLQYDHLDPRLYDRDNGEGAAKRALGLLWE